ncbi:MAG TPA: dipeptide epimerase [Candidatus Limnocylindrales bacterium]|jgi:L-alanine-DL-glutamate epimerase-like enolase superfamily enzyme
MRAATEVLALRLRDPFRIARSSPDRDATTVIGTLTDADGLTGIGEGYPDPYYGETPATVEAVVPVLVEAVDGLGAMPERPDLVRGWLVDASAAMDERIAHNGAAKCLVDLALHDLAGQRLGLALPELLGTPRELPPTDFSIGIDEPAVVAQRAARAAHFPALKIKLGGPADLETLEAVRDVYAGPIRVDANTGWTPEVADALLPHCLRLGVELIEQPFKARRLDQLRWLQERSPLPIVADESAVVEADLGGLVGVVQGINIKLAKVGGVGPALRMIRHARELGFRIFLGCMEETGLGIAASASVAGLADWVDLDGNLLLATDPFTGLELGADCRWQLPTIPGIGVRRVGVGLVVGDVTEA